MANESTPHPRGAAGHSGAELDRLNISHLHFYFKASS